MSYRDECMELAATLAVELHEPAPVATRLAKALLKDAATVQRYAEAACNRQTTEIEIERARQAEKRIHAVLASYPFSTVHATFGHDPRGLCTRLRFASGRHNNWDGETYGVPVAQR